MPNLRTRRAFIEVRLNQSHIFIDVGLKLSYIKDIAIQQGFAGSAVGASSRQLKWSRKQIPAGLSLGGDREDLGSTVFRE